MTDKHKSEISAFINKINNETFDSSTISAFYISVRRDEIKGLFRFSEEIADFVAHQTKDKGILMDMLSSWDVISDFIKDENLHQSRVVDSSSFPGKVFKAIRLLYGDDLLRLYTFNLNQKRYVRNTRLDKKNTINKYVQNVFFAVDLACPLMKASLIYEEFFRTVNFFARKYSLKTLIQFGGSKKRDLMICILSALANTKIIKANKYSVEPYFAKTANGSIKLIYKNFAEYQAVFFKCEGGSTLMEFCDFEFKPEDYSFYDGASILERNSEGLLRFV